VRPNKRESALDDVQNALGGLDSSVQSADPQLDVIDRVFRWFDAPVEQADIRTGLLLGLGLLLELGSGLGLYTVTTPWRHCEGDFRTKMTILGDAAVWADERLQVVQGGRLTANMVFELCRHARGCVRGPAYDAGQRGGNAYGAKWLQP
jgi:hypothetical protein